MFGEDDTNERIQNNGRLGFLCAHFFDTVSDSFITIFKSMRLSLDRKDILITQLRALLRASVYGQLKIMFPIKVTDPAGLHARPASHLLDEASKFKSEVDLEVGEKRTTLKSILGIISLGIKCHREEMRLKGPFCVAFFVFTGL